MTNNFKILIIFLFCTFLGSCKKAAKEIVIETTEKEMKDVVKHFPIDEISTKYLDKRVLKINPTRAYNRHLIDKEFKIVKAQFHKDAVEKGNKLNLGKAVFTDGYTGKRLLGGEAYEYDHVRSAQSIYNKYKSILTDEEISKVVNCKENIITVSTKINRSKGKWDIEYLLKNQEKVKELGINKELTISSVKKSDIAIKRKVQEILSSRK